MDSCDGSGLNTKESSKDFLPRIGAGICDLKMTMEIEIRVGNQRYQGRLGP